MSSHFVGRRTLRVASALTLAVTTGLTALVALPATAGAAVPAARLTSADRGRAFDYTAAPGQTNRVAVTATFSSTPTDGPTITYVIDDVVPIDIDVSEGGCTHPDNTDRTKVSCTKTGMDPDLAYATLYMKLGDGNDTVAFGNATGQVRFTASIDLGAGKDRLTRTGGVDGNDSEGGPGDDIIDVGVRGLTNAGDGNDTIHGAAGSVLSGQNGVDTIDVAGDYGWADGGPGNDVVQGGAGHQTLIGGDGNDSLRGGAGDDSFFAGKGADSLYGNSGNDTLYGNSGNDKLYGGPGRDTLSGGPGRDVVRQD
ncbi:calcium-binding protein [Streptomyces sp. SID12488]|uniref:calcium-binding protein n=1 Tax=Streptomyces sp. SID12488 TaxID=2706040 RepID=UPI0013DA3B65|nr:calcium-binding protein [Streptomyces sp. SID12488]NEA64594.1 calcium-binding protein [Streptomyces sp. SID12488]